VSARCQLSLGGGLTEDVSMDSTFKFLGFGASVVICSLMAGCSEGTDDPAGTGGSTGATGGSSSTGGASSGGTSSGAAKLFTFDIDEEGWTLSNVEGTVPYTNLVKPAVEPIPMLSQASKDAGSDTNSGSLKITANFTFWNQSVAAEVAAPTDSSGVPVDFTGKTVTARVFIEPMGLSPFGFGDPMDAPGGVVFYMKSGSTFAWGQAPWFNVVTYNSWFSVKFNAAELDSGSTAEFKASNVVQLGLSFSSGGGGVHCPDSAAAGFLGEPTATCKAWDAPLPTVIYIDNITVTPN
jgi:hypothetical protein